MSLHQGIAGVVVASLLAACGGAAQNAAPDSPSTPAAATAPAASEKPPSGEPAAPADSAAPADPDTAGEATAAAGGDPDKRTMDVIAAAVKAHRKEARDCYEKGLKQVPGLKGDLVVHFVLKPSGKIKVIELNRERSTITEGTVVSCVIDVVSAIEFPKSSRGMETTVNYPFNFNP
jgi:hypothetical protein